MGRGAQQTLLQRRNSDGQQAHEKMLHIANHQRSANENHMTYYFTPVRQLGWPPSKRQRKNVGNNVEKGEPSDTSGGNVNCSTIVESSMEAPQKTKNRNTI